MREPKYVGCSVEGCEQKHYGRGFCRKHHQWHWNHGHLKPLPVQTIEQRLMAGVQMVTETGCWLWTSKNNGRGYGQMSFNGKHTYVHRLAYQAFKGEIPHRMVVCHKCDTPSCCNPDHLFLGTTRDNSRDMVRKGRHSKPPRLAGKDHPRKTAILTEAKVIEMIRRYESGETIRSIAKFAGVRPVSASKAIHGITWSYVREAFDKQANESRAASL